MKNLIFAFALLVCVTPIYGQGKPGHANASTHSASANSSAQPQNPGASQSTVNSHATGTATHVTGSDESNNAPQQHAPGQVCKVKNGKTYHCM